MNNDYDWMPYFGVAIKSFTTPAVRWSDLGRLVGTAPHDATSGVNRLMLSDLLLTLLFETSLDLEYVEGLFVYTNIILFFCTSII